MNCECAKERIVEALASCDSGVRGELDQHLQNCNSCRIFFEKQTALHRAIDSHLRVMVKQPIPPSLLPQLRVRLQEDVSLRPAWFSGWRIAAIVALVILAAAASIPMRRSGKHDHPAESASHVVTVSPSRNHPPSADGQVQVSAAKSSPARTVRKASIPEPASTPEILVSREEQKAFTHFVTQLSRDRDSAFTLASVTPVNDDAPIEIALLTFKSVEVTPLEGSGDE